LIENLFFIISKTLSVKISIELEQIGLESDYNKLFLDWILTVNHFKLLGSGPNLD